MYVKIKSGNIERYPYSLDILRKENSNISFPQNLTKELLESFGVYRVIETDRPETNESSYAVKRHLPELVDGEYKLLWDVKQKTAEQIAEEIKTKKVQVRDQRNDLLSASDWTQLADAPVDKAAWATYRQALRDLPQQPGFPDIDLPRSPDSVEIGE
jgi:hypothetical protein